MLKYLKGEETSGHKAVTYDFHDKIFLLAEDNELNREIAAELLGNFGARLDTAVNGEEMCIRDRSWRLTMKRTAC